MLPLSTDFVLGAIVAAVLLSLIAFILNILGRWNRSIQAFFRPQSITLQTRQTPAQVTWAALRAYIQRLIFWFVILVLCVLFVSKIFFPDWAERIIEPINTFFGI